MLTVADYPLHQSPVIGGFVRRWIASTRTADEEVLVGALPRPARVALDSAAELRRQWMALDWLLREYVPAVLDLDSETAPHATTLRALPEIVDMETARGASSVVAPMWDAVRRSTRLCATIAAADAAREALWYSPARAAGDAMGTRLHSARGWSGLPEALRAVAIVAAAHLGTLPGALERVRASAVELVGRMAWV